MIKSQVPTLRSIVTHMLTHESEAHDMSRVTLYTLLSGILDELERIDERIDQRDHHWEDEE